jgi:2-oxoglutarate ferredoxin oxidoreductase subunit gamma
MIVRFAGFGGQGIVLSSYILGQSAVTDGKKAIQNQAYGSESRGGECRGDVIISDGEIYELEPTGYDVLVALTQPAYEKFVPFLRTGGTLVTDKDLVIRDNKFEPENISVYEISFTDIAFKKFKRKIVANMVILGYINTLLKLVTEKSLEKTISMNVPKGTEELNLGAMREGMAIARKEKAPAKTRATGKRGKRGSKK